MENTFDGLANVEKKDVGVWDYIAKKLTKSGNNEDNETIELVKNLKIAQLEFESAINNYEFAKEPDLVDYYTYNIKATQTRYQYLLKKAKEKGL